MNQPKQNPLPPSDTVNVACIGLGMMGTANLIGTQRVGANVVALCDVDTAHLDRASEHLPKATRYTDYRRLLEKEKGVDGVIVSTPNHTHAVISIAAMQLGKHVYCEKPLAHTIYEMRKMAEAADRYGVATQLGNQGNSYTATKEFCECIRSGVIGEIREAHLAMFSFNFSLIDHLSRLGERQPTPETLDWDLWLGPVEYREFNKLLHPGSWRASKSFSTGLIGDMFCHIADPVFQALSLGPPDSILAEAEGYDPTAHGQTFPKSAKVRFQFPARGSLPPLTMTWYDGDLYKPPRPEELADDEDFIPFQGSAPVGGYVIGDKGKMVYGSHGASRWRIIPEREMEAYLSGREVVEDERGPGMPDCTAHHSNWLQACRGGAPAGSNSAYGTVISETATLGDLAQRFPGQELHWDSKHMVFPNCPEANQYLHYPYRKGWYL